MSAALVREAGGVLHTDRVDHHEEAPSEDEAGGEALNGTVLIHSCRHRSPTAIIILHKVDYDRFDHQTGVPFLALKGVIHEDERYKLSYIDQPPSLPLSSCDTLNSPHVVPSSGLMTGTQRP